MCYIIRSTVLWLLLSVGFVVVVVVVLNFSGALTAKYRHFRGEVPQPQDKEEVYQVHELAVIMQCAYMHTYLIQC